MTVSAAATFLRTLREKRSLSQVDVADQVGVSSKMIGEWEKARSEPSSSKLAAWSQAVHGSAEIIHALLLDKDADEQVGREFAQQWIMLESEKQLTAAVNKYGLEAVVRGAVASLETPGQIERLIRQIEHETDDSEQ